MTLIELDRDAPLDPEAGRRPPPWRYRHAGLLVVAVLLIALGGAAPGPAVLWRYLGAIDAKDAVSPIQLAGGRLYTVTSTGRERAVTAWEMTQPARRLWTVQVPMTRGHDPAQSIFGSIRVQRSGDLVLLSESLATTAVDTATGRTRWTSPVRITVAGGVGYTVGWIFRPGTAYDESSGDPGALYFSADGEAHTEPPVRTELRGVDLATGKQLWAYAAAGAATVDPAPGTPAALLITSSDRLTLRAVATGDVLAETELVRIDGAWPTSASVVGDVVLVEYQEAARELVYEARTLRRIWQREISPMLPDAVDCQDVLCSADGGETWVLDPATGRPVWPVTEADRLYRRAGYLLETDAATGAPVRLVDPRTGASRVDLEGWAEEVGGATEDGPLLLRRGGAAGGQTFGVVLPGHPEVRLLGTAEVAPEECAADEHHLVCRDEAGLRIWAYRI
ncbi:PQQ-like beta-propeller repeat protein [Actinoplanes sp. NBC_00393]|uniref:outer membrane protein assembly factor BamB family protein n=1 Tax=Actinoplanes sp. NBC_00393 TaxID=2975953 RepID=UPI002E1AA741